MLSIFGKNRLFLYCGQVAFFYLFPIGEPPFVNGGYDGKYTLAEGREVVFNFEG